MAITRYAGDRFTVDTADVKPTGVLPGAFLVDSGNRTPWIKTGYTGSTSDSSDAWVQLAGGGAGGSPGGANTQVQFNQNGSFGGDSDLTFTNGNQLNVNKLSIAGNVIDSNSSIGNNGMVLTNEGTTGVHWKNIESVLSGVGGSGVANYVARWSDEDTLTTGTLVDDGTKVGIGTDAPSRPLSVHMSSAGSIANFLHYTDASNFQGLYMDVSQATDVVTLNNSGSHGGAAIDLQCSSASIMYLKAGGKVGIGTNTPNELLEIFSTGTNTNAKIRLSSSGGTTGGRGIEFFDGTYNRWRIATVGANGNFEIHRSTTGNSWEAVPAISINKADGNVGIGTNAPAQKLHSYASAGGRAALFDGAANWYTTKIQGSTTSHQSYGQMILAGTSSSDKALRIYNAAGNSDLFIVLGDGNVGIGTDAPGGRLDVDTGYMVNEQGRQDHVANTLPQPYYWFDGTNDYIVKATPQALAGTFTISMWINPDDVTGVNLLGLSSSNENYLWINSSSEVDLKSSDLNIEFTDSNIIAGVWQHICITRDGSNIPKFYKNGVLVQTLGADAGTFTFDQIGRYYNGSNTNYFGGSISAVRIYNVALSDTETKELYSGASTPFKYKGANQTHLVTAGSCTEQGSGTINSSSATAFNFSSGALYDRIGFTLSSTLTAGKKYRVSWTGLTISSGYVQVRTATTSAFLDAGGTNFGSISGGANSFEWIALGDEAYITFKNLSTPTTVVLSGFEVVQIGAVSDYDGSGMTGGTWYDKSGNNLDATVTGASLENRATALIVDDKVGIGTNTPSAPLHISGSDNQLVKVASTDAYAEICISDNTTTSTTSSAIGVHGNRLYLYSGGGQRLSVLGDGKVGIGTTAPFRKFHVYATGDQTNENDGAFWVGDSTNNKMGLYGGVNNTSNYSYIGSVRTSQAYEDLILNPNGGNVGIGTNSTSELLHAYKTADAAVAIAVENPNAGTDARARIQLMSNGGTATLTTYSAAFTTSNQNIADSALLRASSLSAGLGLSADGATPLHFWTNDTERIRVDSGGNVGVGTTTPKSLLEASGVIRSTHATSVSAGVGIEMLYNNTAGTGYLYSYDRDGSAYKTTRIGSESYFTADGNVGIATTTPEHQFQVYGDAMISGYFYDSTNSTGVDGYVLTSKEDGPQWKLVEEILSGVGGSGTANYIPKWGDADTLGNSDIVQSGVSDIAGGTNAHVGINIQNDNPATELHVGSYGSPSQGANWASLSVGSAGWPERRAQINAYRSLRGGDWDHVGISFQPHTNTSHLIGPTITGMVIDYDGYVGIGNAEPIGTLEVRSATPKLVISNSTYQSSNQDTESQLGFKVNSSNDDERIKGSLIFKNQSSDYGVGDLLFCLEGTANNTNVTSANEKVRIQSDGNVGIGTNAAGALLQVETDQIIKGGTVRDGTWHRGLEITTENANFASLFFGNQQTTKYSGIVWTSSTSGNTGNKRGAQIYAHPTSAANTNLAFDTNNVVGSSSPTTKMTILGDGNVGIGITAPGYKTKIVSPSLTWGTSINDDTAALSVVKGYQDGANDSDVNVARFASVRASYGATADWAGHISLFTNSSVTNGSEGTERARITWDGNNRLYFGRSTVKVLTVQTAGGNVGIGDNLVAPEHKLHVSGDAIISGVLYDSNNSSGVAGHVFTSEAGGPQWKMIEDVLSGVGGDGTTNYVPKWTDSDTLGDSSIYDNGSVGISTATPGAKLHVYDTAGGGDQVLIENTNAGAADAPDVVLYRNSASPANSDDLGIIRFKGKNDGTDTGFEENKIIYADIEAEITSVVSGSEGGALKFYTQDNGTSAARITITGDKVGIGVSTPSVGLEVKTPAAGDAFKVIDRSSTDVIVSASYGSTTDEGLLDLLKNNVSKVRLRADNDSYFNGGSVGIGTTSPQRPLHVVGADGVSGGTDGNSDAVLVLDNDDASIMNIIAADAAYSAIMFSEASTQNAGFIKYDHPNNRMEFRTNSVDDRLVIQSDGNVGIGTNSSGSKLTIVKNAASDKTIILANNTSASGRYSSIVSQHTAGDDSFESSVRFIKERTGSNYGSSIGFLTELDTAGKSLDYRLYIKNGNVGIGTTAPGSLLRVEGSNATAYDGDAAQDGDGVTLSIWNQDQTALGSYAALQLVNKGTGSHGKARIACIAPANNQGALAFTVENAGTFKEAMRILGDGKVLINDTATTNNNNAQLYVNGPVYGSEFDLPSGGVIDWANGDARIVEGLVSNYSLSLQNYNGVSAMVTTMFLKSDGNVGIGSTTPAAHLHLYKASGTTTVLTEVNSNSTIGYEIKKTGTTTQHWKIVDGQTVNGVLEFYDATDSLTRMAIDGNGNVGINDSSPTYKLDVNGTFRVTGASVLGTISSDLDPTTNSAYDLGENTNRWANIFADTLYGAGSNITALNATNLSSGTVNTARLGTGTADSSTFLRGDNTWVANANGTVTSITAGSGLSGGTITTSGTIANTDKGSSQNIFKKVRTSNSAGSQIGLSTANSNDDTIDFRQGTGITLATSGDVVTITAANNGTVTGTGTAGYLPRWSTTTNLADSIVSESSGKIGINIDPAVTLHVLGDAVKFERTNAAVALQLYNNHASPADDAALGYLQFMGKDNDGTANIVHSEVRGGVQSNSDTAVNGYLAFLTTNNGTAVTEWMRIKSDGKVGIGTNNPGNNLHILTDANAEGLLIKSTGNTYSDIVLDSNRSAADSNLGQFIGKWNGTQVATIAFLSGADTTNKDDGEIAFYTAPAGTVGEKMRISSTGLVGVGTNDPVYTLQGNGTNGGIIGATRTAGTTTGTLGVLRFGNTDVDSNLAGINGVQDGATDSAKLTFSTQPTGGSTTTRMEISSVGAIKLNTYGSGTHTGTSAYKLSVDSSGNIIETSIGSGAVDGSGTAGKITKWTDSDTIGDSIMSDSGAGTITITNAASGWNTGLISANTNADSSPAMILLHKQSASPANSDYIGGTVFKGRNSANQDHNYVEQWAIATNVTDGAESSKWSIGTWRSGTEHHQTLVANAGSVGIGTNNPAYPLHVRATTGDVRAQSSTGTNRAGYQANNTGGTSYFYRESSGGQSTITGALAYSTVVGGSGAYPLHLGTNGAIKVTVASGGNVGIGETVPGAKLTVAGNAIITSTNPLYMGGTATTINTWVSKQYATGGVHYLGCNGFQINNAGYVSPATIFLNLESTGKATFKSILNTHNYHYIDTTSADYNPILGFVEAGTRRAYINYVSASNYLSITTEEASSDIAIMAAGKVGVGTTSPEYAFEVKESITGSWVSRIYNPASTGNPYGLLVRVDKAAAADTHFGVYNGTAHTFAVKGDGKVGIGTTVPSSKLSVVEDTVGTSVYASFGPITTSAQTREGGIQIHACSSTDKTWGVWADANNPVGLRFEYLGARATAFGSGTSVLTLDGVNDRVGIGNPSPIAQLHLQVNTSGGHLHLTRSDNSLTGQMGEITFGNRNYDDYLCKIRATCDSTAATAAGAGGFLAFDTEASGGSLTERLRIGSDGNVGIGTNNPAYLLDVNGSVQVRGANTLITTGRMWYSSTVTVIGSGTANGQAITLNSVHGTTLNDQYHYIVDVTTTGTGSRTGAQYVIWYDKGNTVWVAHQVSVNGTGSNNPLMAISGTAALIYDNHTGTYTQRYNVETRYIADSDGMPQSTGPYYMWSRTIDDLYYTGGDVGIGTASPGYRLDVYDTASDIAIFRSTSTSRGTVHIRSGAAGDAQLTFKNDTSSKWTIGNDGGDSDKFKIATGSGAFAASEAVIVDTSGNLSILGTLTEASSIAIKENVETYSPSLEKINKMRAVRFNKKKSKKKEVGLVAEELAEMFPELVETDEKGNPSGVNYSRAVAVLLHGFKELYKEVKELKEKI